MNLTELDLQQAQQRYADFVQQAEHDRFVQSIRRAAPPAADATPGTSILARMWALISLRRTAHV